MHHPADHIGHVEVHLLPGDADPTLDPVWEERLPDGDWIPDPVEDEEQDFDDEYEEDEGE
jgi:hypothetical protein